MFSSQDPEAGFEGSYGGKQKQANGVISMLEAWKLWLHWELLHQWHLNQSKSCFIFPVFETAQSLPTFGRWSVMTLRSLRQALKSLKIRQQMSSPNSNCNQRQTSVARQLRRSWTRRSKMVEGREDLVFFFFVSLIFEKNTLQKTWTPDAIWVTQPLLMNLGLGANLQGRIGECCEWFDIW